MSGKLTRYESGSIGEIITIAYPLILTSFSVSIMLFVNRMFLARYSIDAMNSVVAVGTIIAALQIGFSTIAAIAEVFVGRFNGSRTFGLVGTPIWQMIWFICASSILFICIGLFLGQYIVPKEFHDYGLPYFRYTMSMGFVMPLISAVASFYIGLGRVFIVTLCAVIGNVINILTSFFIINGFHDIIPAMGVKGAAISYIFAQIVQFLLLLILFMRKKEDQYYGTRRWQFNKDIMKDCIKLGLPICLSRIVELIGWSSLYVIIVHRGTDYLTIYNIGNSIFIILLAFNDGVQKSVVAIASNLIGSYNFDYISQLMKSAAKFLFVITFITALIFYFFGTNIIIDFVGENILDDYLLGEAQWALLGVLIYFYIDSIMWATISLLVAGGDSKFILIVKITCVWIGAIIPTYIIFNYFDPEPSTLWLKISNAYILLNSFVIYLRYKSNKWLRVDLEQSKTLSLDTIEETKN